MKIAMVGLGKMGSNMAKRLMKGGHEVVVQDVNPAPVAELVKLGATGAATLEEVKQKLGPSAVVWIMLPAGEVTEGVVQKFLRILEPGDLIVDGGNSYFKDDVRHAKLLGEKGIKFADAGVSGGIWGAERGYCVMVGGEPASFARIEPVIKTLAPGVGEIPRTPGRKPGSQAEQGYLYTGPVGSGHFVKMVHNGIEYGMMQAFAEGFDILKNVSIPDVPAERRYDLNLPDIAELWRRGSVVSSWLLDLLSSSLTANGTLSEYSGFVHDSGEGRWTIEAAIEEAVPADVLAASLFARFSSRQEHSFANKVLSAMRQGFGGHVEAKKN